jgi:Ca2+-binding RTX toxin-like protein
MLAAADGSSRFRRSFKEATVAIEIQQRIAPPIPFLTAVWAGMSHDDIRTGLRNGDIVRPARLPDWATDLDQAGFMTAPAAAEGGAQGVDRARVNGWFSRLDPDLSASSFESLWNRAGATESDRAANLTSYLARLLLPEGSIEAANDARNPQASALDAVFQGNEQHATIVDLGGKTGQELAALAKTDIGYRYALAHLDPFAVTGNRDLFATANPEGSLDRFDADTGEALVSDAWLADRGKFLAWRLRDESGGSMIVEGDQDWTFIDRGTKGADGAPLTLEIKSGAEDAGRNQVVFGTDAHEIIKGISGSDRIYAGQGDDVLRGGGGADRLEGGDGDDIAMGGAGNDELSGGRGDDELDGGRGDDRLEGGSGDDTYVIDAGDGADTILDADGNGTIELDGEALGGTMEDRHGEWQSADGHVRFTFSGDLATGGTLTISRLAEGAGQGEGTPSGAVTVNNWKNGDLGITLGGGTVDASQTSPQGEEHLLPALSTADLTSDTWEDQDVLSLDGSGSVSSAVAPQQEAEIAADNGSSQAFYGGGEGAIEAAVDLDAALESLLGSNDPGFTPVDPNSYQQAMQAFSGVLAPPDVPGAAASNSSFDVGAVTEAAMADAIAADYSSDAFDAFQPMPAQPIPSVDVASLMEMKRPGMEVGRSAGG